VRSKTPPAPEPYEYMSPLSATLGRHIILQTLCEDTSSSTARLLALSESHNDWPDSPRVESKHRELAGAGLGPTFGHTESPLAASGAIAGWYPDPFPDRAEERYWNREWTQLVRDDGRISNDIESEVLTVYSAPDSNALLEPTISPLQSFRDRYSVFRHLEYLGFGSRDGKGRRWSRARMFTKRLVDLAGASILLIVLAPVFVAAALIIKLEDRGPVMFRQVRIGRNSEPFTILKFRTMRIDAEARLADLRHRSAHSGPLFKISDDPRISRVGRFLRRYAIDELPQLIAVLTGKMSLVGPRPALPAELATFDEEFGAGRHSVRPGITGLWQVSYGSDPSFERYRELDLEYVRSHSWRMDVSIIARTFVMALSGRGGSI
jgi:lipopolysaccharide/colanic/teichoic acid biosynthesis glycosyltransferase